MKHLADFPELEAFALEHLNITSASFKGWKHAESLVWALETKTASYFLKAHKQDRKFQQEVFAYENWTAIFGRRAAQLVAKHKGQRSMILSGLPGTLVEAGAFNQKQYLQIYQQAGSLLKQLHDQPYKDTDIPLAQALQHRFASWSLRGQGILAKSDLDWTAFLLKAHESLFATYKRVPCHQDYSPRNWLWDEQTLYLIDFEHAKPNLALADFVRLASYHFPDHEAWEEAFWQGYGRELQREEKQLLEFLSIFEALTTIVWATEHHDEGFRAMAERTLERLKQTKSADF